MAATQSIPSSINLTVDQGIDAATGLGVLRTAAFNYVWDPIGLAWVKETQPTGGGGGGGTVTQGPAAALAGAWPIEITDATHGPVAVKAASTAAAGADPSLVVGLSPNSPLPAGTNALGSVTVTGTPAVSISGTADVSDRVARLLGHVSLDSGGTLVGQKAMAASVPVVIASDQSGVAVTGAFFPATQPVSGTVAVSNFPATQPVSGTVTSNQGTAGTNAQAWWAQLGDTTRGPVAVKAASTAVAAADVALAVSLSPNSPLPAGSNALGSVTVTGTSTISGTVTANQGTPAAIGNSWLTELTDGTTGPVAVKAASTAVAAADKALAVSLSPNSALPAGANALGSVTVTGTTTIAGTVVQGNAGSNAQAWWAQLGDTTTGPVAVKAASTAVAAADKALAVSLSPNSPLPAGANALGSVTVTGTSAVSGTVTANQGTPAAIGNSWLTELTDGARGPVAVKAASTAVAATDVALAVSLSPNSALPAGANALGSVTVTGTTTIAGTVVQGNAGTNAQAWWAQLGDTTTGPVAVKAASTAVAAADKALAISLSPNSPLPAGANALGSVTVTGTSTISGTVTSNQGTPAAIANSWLTELTDGTTGPVAVKAASTAVAAADKALAVSLSPNSPLPAGANALGSVTVTGTSAVSGTVTANQGTPAAIGNSWLTELTDGVRGPVAVKAASTAVAATDVALAVSLSPNSALPAGANALGSVTVTGTTTIAGTVVQGNAGTNAQAWWAQLGDTTNGPVAVKAASTAVAAADKALAVSLSPNSPLPAGANALGSVTVTGTSTVSGTVTANQGNAGSNAQAWWAQISDATRGPVAVKAASTAVAAADVALAVSLSPNSPLPAGANALGSVTVTGTVNQGTPAADTAAAAWPVVNPNQDGAYAAPGALLPALTGMIGGSDGYQVRTVRTDAAGDMITADGESQVLRELRMIRQSLGMLNSQFHGGGIDVTQLNDWETIN